MNDSCWAQSHAPTAEGRVATGADGRASEAAVDIARLGASREDRGLRAELRKKQKLQRSKRTRTRSVLGHMCPEHWFAHRVDQSRTTGRERNTLFS